MNYDVIAEGLSGPTRMTGDVSLSYAEKAKERLLKNGYDKVCIKPHNPDRPVDKSSIGPAW